MEGMVADANPQMLMQKIVLFLFILHKVFQSHCTFLLTATQDYLLFYCSFTREWLGLYVTNMH